MGRLWGPDDGTCKRILDILKTVYLSIWYVVVEWVAVVKLGVHDGGGNGTGSFVIEIWSDATKLMDVRVAGFRQSWYLVKKKDMCSSKMKPRLQAQWAVSSEQELILASCCLSPIRRNSVLDKLRVKRLAVIHEEICCRVMIESAWPGCCCCFWYNYIIINNYDGDD